MSAIRAVLFDLDGTLLDSAPDLVASLNHVRSCEQLPPLPLGEISKFASRGAVGLLRAGMPPANEQELETRRQRFLEHYAANSYRNSSLYDGIPEVLAFLADAGIPWGIVTNKIESLTLPILEAAKLSAAVSCVVCGDTLRESKPHPAPVSHACGLVAVAPANALLVGDDIRDLQAGRAAGTQTAAAYYGYGAHEFDDVQVDGSFRIRRPEELIQIVLHSNGERGAATKQ